MRDRGPRIDPRKAAEMEAGATMGGLEHLKKRIAEIRGNAAEQEQQIPRPQNPVDRQVDMEFEKNFVPTPGITRSIEEETSRLRAENSPDRPQEETTSEDLSRSLESPKQLFERICYHFVSLWKRKGSFCVALHHLESNALVYQRRYP